MTQAQRRDGSRDGLHYARERARPTSYPRNKPYKARLPEEDASPTASILKTRAFKLLVTAVGSENIAMALDSNLARVTELENGKGFTAETAFHMETTLGLPDGFFDQPDPVLAPEIIARLKSPLEFWQATAVAETDGDVTATVGGQTVLHGFREDRLLAEDDMPRNKRSAAAQSTARNGTAVPQKVATVGNASRAKSKGSRNSDSTQSRALEDPKTLAEIRRINLHTLTRQRGAKAQLGRLLQISQSNMAHRLHGQKRLDDVEAKRITDMLDLPAGWLDIPREPADLPESVAVLLSPPSRRPSIQPQSDNLYPDTGSSSRVSTQDSCAVKTGSAQLASPITGQNLALSEIVLPEPASGPPSQQTLDSGPSTMLVQSDQALQSTLSATSGLPEAYPSRSTTSLETLHGIAPIAEALLKTLAGKARTGRLDESRALQLLQQVVLL